MCSVYTCVCVHVCVHMCLSQIWPMVCFVNKSSLHMATLQWLLCTPTAWSSTGCQACQTGIFAL